MVPVPRLILKRLIHSLHSLSEILFFFLPVSAFPGQHMKRFGDDIAGACNASRNLRCLLSPFLLCRLFLSGRSFLTDTGNTPARLRRRVLITALHKTAFGKQIVIFSFFPASHSPSFQKLYSLAGLLVLQITPAQFKNIPFRSGALFQTRLIHPDQLPVDAAHTLQQSFLLRTEPQGFHTVFLCRLKFSPGLIMHGQVFVCHIMIRHFLQNQLKAPDRSLFIPRRPENLPTEYIQPQIPGEILQQPADKFRSLLRPARILLISGLLQNQIGMPDGHGRKRLKGMSRSFRILAVILTAEFIIMIKKGIVICRVLSLKPFIGKIVIALTLTHHKIYEIGRKLFPELRLLLLKLKSLVDQLPDLRLNPIVFCQKSKQGVSGLQACIQRQTDLLLQKLLPALRISSSAERHIYVLHFRHPLFYWCLRLLLLLVRAVCISICRLIGLPESFKTFRIILRVRLYKKTAVRIPNNALILCLLYLQY